MAIACSIIPKVRNSEGNLVSSQLFENALDSTNDRDTAKVIWGLGRTSTDPNVSVDNNGEPLLDSLLSSEHAERTLGTDKVVEVYNDVLSSRAEKATVSQCHNKANESVLFNETNRLGEKVTAYPEVDDGTVKVKLKKRSDGDEALRGKLKTGDAVTRACTSFCERHGIDIGLLSEAEEGAGIEAVADFSAMNRIGDGFVTAIRIGRGDKNIGHLPEETAHVITAHLEGRDEIVDRLLNILYNNEAIVRDILGDSYDTYAERYGNDSRKLVHEAAGHLISKQLEGSAAPASLSSHKSFLSRLVDAIKRFFKSLIDGDIEHDLQAARSAAGSIASQITSDNDIWQSINFSDEIKAVGNLYALSEKTDNKVKSLFGKLKTNLGNEMKSLVRGGSKTKFKREHVKELQETFDSSEDTKELINAISEYAKNMVGDLKYQIDNWAGKMERSEGDISTRIFTVNNILNTCDSYERICNDISTIASQILNDEVATEEKEAAREIISTLKKVNEYLLELRPKATSQAMDAFISYIKLFMPNDVITVSFEGEYGRHRGEQITFQEAIEHSWKDIGLFETFLTSGAMTASLPVALVTNIIQRLKESVRANSNRYTDLIKNAALKAEEDGIDNFDFMFERDDNGKITGKYISSTSDDYLRLSEAQKIFYNEIMRIKEELDDFLPDNVVDLLSAPKVRKDFFEALSSAKDGKGKVLMNKLSEMVKITSDDEYSLQDDAAVLAYDGRRMHLVPLRFLKFAQDEDMDNLSTDIVETLSLYAQMACNYSIMNEALPALEVAERLIKEGTVGTEVETDEFGNTVNVPSNKRRGESSNEVRLLKGIYEMLIDGILVKRSIFEIGGKKIDVTKAGQSLMALTALQQYALNVMGGIQNEITGLFMGLFESVGSRSFNASDLAWAHKAYASNLPDLFSDMAQRNKTSKISLFSRMFNVMQKDEKENFVRKTMLGQIAGDRVMYFTTELGEHNLHHLTALAVAHHTKVYDKDGNLTTLWDALEVIDIKERELRRAEKFRADGDAENYTKTMKEIESHPEWANSNVKVLAFKKGTRQSISSSSGDSMIGPEIDDVYIAKMTRRIAKLNFRMHGIYNKTDRCLLQRNVFGQLLMMYRKWMYPSLQKRLMRAHRDFDTEEDVEGTWRTAGKFLLAVVDDLRKGEFNLSKNWNDMTAIEIKNAQAALFEWAVCISVAALAGALWRFKRKDREGFKSHYLYYFMRRTACELGFYHPLGIVDEVLRTMKNPMACLPVIENTINLIHLLNPINYETIAGDDALVRNGDFKGWSIAEKTIAKSPFGLFRKQILTVLRPDKYVRFYEM